MPKISLIADTDLITALNDDQSLPMSERVRLEGTASESERFGFELGSVETLIGYIAAGVELIGIAKSLVSAGRRSRHPKLEIVSPTGRVSVNLEGRTAEEVAELVHAALPFTH